MMPLALRSASALLNSTCHRPLLRAPTGVPHHTRDAVDAEPRVPEASVDGYRASESLRNLAYSSGIGMPNPLRRADTSD
jgi:hypothetical protein